jgi:hypothetical protein
MEQSKDWNEANDVEKPESECAPVHRFVRHLCGVRVDVECQQCPVIARVGEQLGTQECVKLAFSSEADAVTFLERSYRPNVAV